jgi:tetratricopeptide (TPR) repeat protein
MSSKLVERRLNDFKRRCGKDGDAALQLAYHAAMPVALNPELLHFLRINFFLDPPEQLPYTVEFEFLTSGLCREIDAELYEIEPEIRNELLQELTRRKNARQRIRDVATLLWQYVEYHSPWADRVELERAQQLTALNFLDPAKAKEWLDTAEADASLGRGEREWFIAMRQEIEQISNLSDDEPNLNDLNLTILSNRARVIAQQGDIERAIALWEQYLEILERIGDVSGKATIVNNIAQVVAQQGDIERAIALWQQSLELYERIGDVGGKATTLNNMAQIIAQQGDITRAIALWQQSLEIKERIGDVGGKAATLNNMAQVIAQQGDITHAITLWEQSLEILERIGDVGGKATTLNNMAGVIAQQGDITRAIALWEQSLEIFERIGDVSGKATILSNRARVIAQQSDKAVDYTRLRDLLAASKWKEADEETLAVMLKATEREKDGWLDIESIENFPCTDLRTIDQLWVKYSNGRFGFSVQKRIWESVGGNPNADYETFEKFGDRVGWRRRRTKSMQKEWLDYDELNFTTKAKVGHLPWAVTSGSVPMPRGLGAIRGYLEWVRTEEADAACLFSRIQTCHV